MIHINTHDLGKPHSCSSTKRQTRRAIAGKTTGQSARRDAGRKATPLQLRNICARYPVRMFDSLKILKMKVLQNHPSISKYIIVYPRWLGHWNPLKCWNNHGLAHQEPPPFCPKPRNLETTKPRYLDHPAMRAAPGSSQFDGPRQELRRDLDENYRGIPSMTLETPWNPNILRDWTFQTWWIDPGLSSKITLYSLYHFISSRLYCFEDDLFCFLSSCFSWEVFFCGASFNIRMVKWPDRCYLLGLATRVQVPGYAVFANTWLSNHVTWPIFRGGLQASPDGKHSRNGGRNAASGVPYRDRSWSTSGCRLSHLPWHFDGLCQGEAFQLIGRFRHPLINYRCYLHLSTMNHTSSIVTIVINIYKLT